MIFMKSAVVDMTTELNHFVRVEYEIHPTTEELRTFTGDADPVQQYLCNELLSKIYGITVADLKELLPEKFI